MKDWIVVINGEDYPVQARKTGAAVNAALHKYMADNPLKRSFKIKVLPLGRER